MRTDILILLYPLQAGKFYEKPKLKEDATSKSKKQKKVNSVKDGKISHSDASHSLDTPPDERFVHY